MATKRQDLGCKNLRQELGGKILPAVFCVAPSGYVPRAADGGRPNFAMSPSRQFLRSPKMIALHPAEPLFRLHIDAAQERILFKLLPHSWERAP
jgi:hypothetical protein